MNFLVAVHVALLIIRIDGCKSKALNGVSKFVNSYYHFDFDSSTVVNDNEIWLKDSAEFKADDATRSTLMDSERLATKPDIPPYDLCSIRGFNFIAKTPGCKCGSTESKVSLGCENSKSGNEDPALTNTPIGLAPYQALLGKVSKLEMHGLSSSQVLEVLKDAEKANNLMVMEITSVNEKEQGFNQVMFRSRSVDTLEIRDSEFGNLGSQALSGLPNLTTLAFTKIGMSELPDMSRLKRLFVVHVILNPEMTSLRGTLSLGELNSFRAINNNINTISDTFFTNCVRLRNIFLDNNKIEKLNFVPTYVEHLTLINNNLRSIRLKSNSNLKKLFVGFNKIKSLTGTLATPELREFHANDNNIRFVSSTFFKDCEKLTTIVLDNNQIYDMVALMLPKSVKYLSLVHNKLSAFSVSMNSYSDLETLLLQYNAFTEIPENCFPKSLTQLDLSNNEEIIRSFPNISFATKPPRVFKLSNNTFICSCDLQWLKDYIRYREVNLSNFQNLTCQDGKTFENFEFCPATTTLSTEQTTTIKISSIITTNDPTSNASTSETTLTNITASINETSVTTTNQTLMPPVSSTKPSITTENPDPNTSIGTTTFVETPKPETTTSVNESLVTSPAKTTRDLVTTPTEIPKKLYDNLLNILNMSVVLEEYLTKKDTMFNESVVTLMWNGLETASRWRNVIIKHRDANDTSYTEVSVNSLDGNYSYAVPQGSDVRVNCIDIGSDLPYNILDGNCFVSSRASAPGRPPGKEEITANIGYVYIYIGLGSLALIIIVGVLLSYQIRERVKDKPPIFYPVPRSLRGPPVPPRRTSAQSSDTYISVQKLPSGNFFVINGNQSPSIPRVGRISPYGNLRQFYTCLDGGTLDSNGYLRITEGSLHLYESIGSGKFIPKSLRSGNFSTKSLPPKNLVNKSLHSGTISNKSLSTKKYNKTRTSLNELQKEFCIKEFFQKIEVTVRKRKNRGLNLQRQLEKSLTVSGMH